MGEEKAFFAERNGEEETRSRGDEGKNGRQAVIGEEMGNFVRKMASDTVFRDTCGVAVNGEHGGDLT